MAKELDSNRDPAGSSTNAGNHKRQRSDNSFNSMLAEKLDMFAVALKDDTPKLPSSAKVLEALHNVVGLDEDIELDLYDILTADLRKFESMMALPPQRRKRWLLKQLKKCIGTLSKLKLYAVICHVSCPLFFLGKGMGVCLFSSGFRVVDNLFPHGSLFWC
jgi:hypothetical protein